MNNQEILEQAQKRVKAKKGFYWHLAAYIAVGIFFGVMSYHTGEPAFFALLPWGIGLFMHYVGVFGIPFLNVLGEDWETKQLQKEIDLLKEKRQTEEDMLLLESEEDIMNINEHDYLQMKKMRENYRDR